MKKKISLPALIGLLVAFAAVCGAVVYWLCTHVSVCCTKEEEPVDTAEEEAPAEEETPAEEAPAEEAAGE